VEAVRKLTLSFVLRSASLSLLTDIDFLPESLDPELFPGVPADVRVHGGFKDAHADTAKEILAETKRLIAEKGAKNVILVC
jgi:hypothetical protein